MSPQNKKIKETESDSEESEKCPSKLGEVDITFTGRYIESHDLDGIQPLLFQSFRTESIDLRELANLLVSQYRIGSVLREDYDDSDMEDDADESVVFGVTSILNLTKNKDKKCIIQLFDLFNKNVKLHAEKSIQEKCEGLMNGSNKLGLLINERFENLPAKVSVPMITMLLKEIDREKKKDTSYDFDYCILISKTYKEGDETIYVNQEDPYFLKNAVLTFDYHIDPSTQGSGNENDAVSHYRKIIIFNASKLNEIAANIENNFS